MNFLNRYTISGIFLGFIGLLYYANFRQPPIYFDRIGIFSLFQLTEEIIYLPWYIDEWIPSFLHIIGMSLFCYGLFTPSKLNQIRIPLFWLATDLIFEFTQAGNGSFILFMGNFEWVDVVALFAATIVSIWLLSLEKQQFRTHQYKKAAGTIAVLVGSYTMLGSYLSQCTYPDGSVDLCQVTPIYMSFSIVRGGDEIYFNPQNANEATQRWIDEGYETANFRLIKNPGKIYLWQEYLFINDRLQGVHIFDNTHPESPKHLAFIKVLGSQDMVIHNKVLYIDSYTDIVAIDLSEFNQTSSDALPIVPLFRNRDLLELPDYDDWLPGGSYFLDADPNQLIIGYQTESNRKFYFWQDEI